MVMLNRVDSACWSLFGFYTVVDCFKNLGFRLYILHVLGQLLSHYSPHYSLVCWVFLNVHMLCDLNFYLLDLFKCIYISVGCASNGK